MIRHWVLGLALLGCVPAQAAELRLVSTSLPPLVNETAGQQSGVAVEVIQAMAKAANRKLDIAMLPWARAQKMAMDGSDIGIFPLERTAAREQSYRWVVQLLKNPVVAVAKAGSPLASIDECKGEVVGFKTNSPGAAIATERGFGQTDPVTEEVQNARKLLAGRIGCWIAGKLLAEQALRDAGADFSAVKQVAILTEGNMYLAASKSIDDAEAKVWQNAFTAIKSDGTYDRIMGKYAE